MSIDVPGRAFTDCQIVNQVLPSVFDKADPLACCQPSPGAIVGEYPSSFTTCDANNKITSLSVINKGSFPQLQISQFFALTRLTSISLQSIGLTGSIPELPSNLLRVNFKNNNLKGSIPSLPPGLISLDLSLNQLIGSIPDLPSTLQSLTIWNNQLTGSIPTLVAGMTTLILTQNQLSGSIPDLPITLSYLELASNNLEGSIPQLPSEMVSLNLANNKLTGTIPPLPIFVQGSGTTVGSAILVGNCFTNPGPFINNCGFNATTTTLRTSPVSGSPSISTITGPLLTVGKASLTPTSIPSSESGPNISAIVGGIIGSIFGIVAIGVFVWWFHRLKQPKAQLEDSSLYLEAAKPSGDYDRRPTVQSQGSSSGGLFSLAGSSYTRISEQTGVSEKTGAGGSVFTTLTAGLERGSAAFLASITPAGREKHLFEGKGGEGNVSPGSGLPGDVSCWSTQNVAYWIYFNHGGEHVARKVMDQKVDGLTLLNAEIDDLMTSLDFEKLGDKVSFKLLLTDLRQKAQASPSYDAPPAYS